METLPDNVEPAGPTPEAPEAEPEMASDAEGDANYQASVASDAGTPEAEAEQPQSVEEPQAPSQTVTAPPEPSPPPSEPPAPDVTPIVPAEVEQLRQRNALLEQQAQAAQVAQQAAEQRAQVDQAQGQYVEYLQTNLGLSPEVAQTVAAQQRQAFDSVATQQQQGDRNIQGYQAKVDLAMKLAETHGVKVTELMVYNDPQSMTNAAQLLKRVADVESAQVKAKQETVPVQGVSESQTSARTASNMERLQDKMNDQGWNALSEAEQAQVAKILQ